jgi:pimeloyl-ACP methyl ester carboxylesterase
MISNRVRRGLTVVLAASVCAGMLVSVGGCFSMQSARRERAALSLTTGAGATKAAGDAQADDSVIWPERDPRVVESFGVAAPRELFDLEAGPGIRNEALDEASKASIGRFEYRIETSEIRSGGLFRTWTKRPSDAPASAFEGKLANLLGGFEANASYLSSYRVNNERWERGRALRREQRSAMNASRLEAGSKTTFTGQSEEAGINEGVRLQLPTKAPANPKGILVHLTSLIPNKYEKAVVDRIAADGWAVVTIDTDSAIRAPRDPEKLAKLPEIRSAISRTQGELFNPERGRGLSESAKKRDTERLNAELSKLVRRQRLIERGEYTLCTPQQTQDVGKAIARATDEVLAENAFAAEAAVAHLDAYMPEVRKLPVLVVGFSAGSLILPAVATRLAARVCGVVIIAGGADLLDISLTTNLEWAAIPIRCEGARPSDAALAELRKVYTQHTHLDPIKTAPRLARLPVLQVHATRDKTVSSASGDRLHDLLGKPDRINFWGDHRLLFYFLPDEADRIAKWVNSNVHPERWTTGTHEKAHTPEALPGR